MYHSYTVDEHTIRAIGILSKIESGTVTLVVQINGKLKDRIEVPSNLTDEEIQDLALASERVKELLDEQEPKRVIVRPPALINIVV